MKKYYVEDRGIKWSYSDLEKAEKKAAEIGSKVESRTFWRYYAPFYTSGTSGYREITGSDLVCAVEKNIDQIIKDHDMDGLSGHKLIRVELIKTSDGADLLIELIKLQKMEKPGDKVSKRISIEGMDPSDLTDNFVFDIK